MSRPSALMAQPQVISTTPSHQATGVSLTTTIDVVTNAKLLQSHISPTMPRVDSVAEYKKPCIYVTIPALYDTLEGNPEYLERIGLQGAVSILNDSTIRLTIRGGLEYETEYKTKIAHLKALIPNQNGFDTVDVQEYSFTFITVEKPHHVISTNLSGKYLRLNDTIKVTFNKPVTSTVTAQGKLAAIRKITGITYLDSVNIEQTYDSVDVSLSLSNNNKTLNILPLGLARDTAFILHLNTGYLTGNNNDNTEEVFYLRDKAKISVSFRSDDSTKTLPVGIQFNKGNDTQLFLVGDTLILKAPPIHDKYYFKGWECPQDASIQSHLTPNIFRLLSYSYIKDLDIQAIYSEFKKDTFEIVNMNPIGGRIIVSNFIDSLGNGIYTTYKFPGYSMMIQAIPDSGKKFTSWSSINYSPADGSIAPMVTARGGSDYKFPGVKYTISHNGFADVNPGNPVGPIAGCTPTYTIMVIGGSHNTIHGNTQYGYKEREDKAFDPMSLTNFPVTGISHGERDDYAYNSWQSARTYTFDRGGLDIDEPFSISVDPGYVIQYATRTDNYAQIPIAGSRVHTNNLGTTWATFRLEANQLNCHRTLVIYIRKATHSLIVEKKGYNNSVITVPDDADVKVDFNGDALEQFRCEHILNATTPYTVEIKPGVSAIVYKYTSLYYIDRNYVVSLRPSAMRLHMKPKGWVPNVGYLTSTSTDYSILNLPINSNKIGVFEWNTEFSLVGLRFKSLDLDDPSKEKISVYSVGGKGAVEYAKIAEYHMISDGGFMKVDLIFNQPVDFNTLRDNVKFVDKFETRMDHTLKTYTYDQYSDILDDPRVSALNDEVVRFAIAAPFDANSGLYPYRQLNNMSFMLVVGSGVKNISGQFISNPLKGVTLATAPPIVKVSLREFKLDHDYDVWGWDADVQLQTSCAMVKFDDANKALSSEVTPVYKSPEFGINVCELGNGCNLWKPIYSDIGIYTPRTHGDVLRLEWFSVNTNENPDLIIAALNKISELTNTKILDAVTETVTGEVNIGKIFKGTFQQTKNSNSINWPILGLYGAAELAKSIIQQEDENMGGFLVLKTYSADRDDYRYWGGNKKTGQFWSNSDRTSFWEEHIAGSPNYRVRYMVELLMR